MLRRKLTEEDRRAVDLVLEHTNLAGGKAPAGLTKMAAHTSPKRLAAAENILSVIAQMPASEPPADLVKRTLARIDRAAGRRVPANRAAVQLPHA